jgi:hypothetical protein
MQLLVFIPDKLSCTLVTARLHTCTAHSQIFFSLKLAAHAGTHDHAFVAISLSQTSSIKLHSCVSVEIILWEAV